MLARVAGALTLMLTLASCGSAESIRSGEWYVSEPPDPHSSVVAITIEYQAYCEEYVGYDVEEDDEEVSVTVRIRVQEPGRGEVCPDVAAVETIDVALERELGNRELVNSADS